MTRHQTHREVVAARHQDHREVVAARRLEAGGLVGSEVVAVLAREVPDPQVLVEILLAVLIRMALIGMITKITMRIESTMTTPSTTTSTAIPMIMETTAAHWCTST